MSAAGDTHDQDLPGLDLRRLRHHLDATVPGLVQGTLRADLIAGGRSNLSYDVTDGEQHWVVRRPPLGHVLATAHDMSREHRVMTALGPTDVPVPETIQLCEDAEVLGAPFFVMEKVPGTPYRDAAQLESIGVERTRAICTRMVDTLARLHAIDPEAVGLADFGRPDGFLTRQVRRWKKQLDASRSRDLPGIDELHAGLERRVPDRSTVAIVHGDYRLDNLLVDDRDEITAVLDWEMATIGDPLTDLGLLAAYSKLAEGTDSASVADAPRAQGFPTTEEVIERYARGSDLDLSETGFYLGLACFKLAVILEGIHYRFTRGQTVGAGFERVGDSVEPLVAAGLNALKES